MNKENKLIKRFWILLKRQDSEKVRKLLKAIKNDEFYLDMTKGIKRKQVFDIYSRRYGLKKAGIAVGNQNFDGNLLENIKNSSSDLIFITSVITQKESYTFFLDSNISSIIGTITTNDLDVDKVKGLIREWEGKSVPSSYIYYSSLPSASASM